MQNMVNMYTNNLGIYYANIIHLSCSLGSPWYTHMQIMIKHPISVHISPSTLWDMQYSFNENYSHGKYSVTSQTDETCPIILSNINGKKFSTFAQFQLLTSMSIVMKPSLLFFRHQLSYSRSPKCIVVLLPLFCS